jgi:hypothetical protein
VHFSSALGDEEDCLTYAEKYSKGFTVPDDDVSSLVSPRLIAFTTYVLLPLFFLACFCAVLNVK